MSKFELCEGLNLLDRNPNILIRQIFVIIKHAAPHLIHDCPYEVIQVYNVTFPTERMFSLFPQGDYKAYVRFYLRNIPESVLNATAILTFNSPIKETFG